MNKRSSEQIKEVIEALLDIRVGYYSKEDIEKAIRMCRGKDRRTIKDWFDYLWSLEYFIQPKLGVYHLNLSKIQELELPMPFQIDPQQRRLV